VTDLSVEERRARADAFRRRLGLVVAPLLFLALLVAPLDLEPGAHRLAAIVALAVVLWVTEAIPLAVTALFAPALAVLMGVTTAKQALAPIASPLIFLFLGGFMIARALQTQGMDRRAALWLLSRPFLGGRPSRVLVAIACAGFVGSMWISNTATAAMLLPVAMGLIAAIDDFLPGDAGALHESVRRYGSGMALALAYACSLGGMATPIGTAPNVITLDLLERHAAISLDFFEWMSFALPTGIACLVGLLAWIRVRYPPPLQQIDGLMATVEAQLRSLGPMKRGERRALLVFGLAVVGWLLPSVLSLSLGEDHPVAAWASDGLDEGIVAILAATILFILPSGRDDRRPVLPWEDAVRIDWGTLYLLGGGLALGKMMFDTGLAASLARGALNLAGPLADSPIGLLALATLLMTYLTEIASNTATTSMMIPVLLAVALELGIDPLPMALCVTMAASNAFMLPVSTPPNAIVYGGGHVRLGEMIRTGFALDLLGFVVIVACGALLLPLLSLG
jgi:sodium-dependent dicarboxylate transporter 2/3/5